MIPLRKDVAPGWYAVSNGDYRIINKLIDIGFELVFSFAYHYIEVTHENRLDFSRLMNDRRLLRVKDIDLRRLISVNLARYAVNRHSGSKAEGQFTAEEIINLLDKQAGNCIGCRVDIRYKFTIDHIIPRSYGGSNAFENIQLLCGSCNSSKRDRSMTEWLISKSISQEVERLGQTITELTSASGKVVVRSLNRHRRRLRPSTHRNPLPKKARRLFEV